MSIVWALRYTARNYNGHVWEYGYWDKRLVAVRCHNCRQQPIETLLKGGGFAPCPLWLP